MKSVRETSLEKGLKILCELSASDGGVTVSQLSRKLGYPESTTTRLLKTLKGLGYVWQGRRRGPYKAGYRLLELAGNMLEGMELRRSARPFLHELASSTSMVSYLKVKSGGDVITIDVAVPPLASGLENEIGNRLPMHVCSPGKAILAARGEDQIRDYIERFGLSSLTSNTITDVEAFMREMRSTRERGYAVNCQESSSDIDSMAVAVRRYDGKVIGSVAVSFDPGLQILGTEREHAVAAKVIQAGRRISFSLGYRAEHLV